MPWQVLWLVLWFMVTGLAGWAGLRLCGWEPKFFWSQLVSFTPYAAALSLVPVGCAAFLRARPLLVAALVVAGAFAVTVLPRAVPERNPPAAGPVLRVLAVNLLHSSVPPSALVEAVERDRPDVLHLLEFTNRMRERVEALGLARLLPYEIVLPGTESEGAAIYSRYPLRPSDTPIAAPVFRKSPRHLPAVVTLPGGREVEVVAVHACAPSEGWRTACWASSIRALPPAGERPRILAGDFNSTLDHAVLRDLIATGYRDAADVTGKGLSMTWPYYEQPRLFPKVAIDHVLADRRIAIRSFRTQRLPRTDHRATLTELVLP
ncbi:endonuclease/exonuclease/phosphatase family protein [Nonomuraea phyllanthi]|uniref:Endonuclease/exonuclease/phosphatase family protein n=1 Tax=Nonomuraea phyllanthi TaxID=2219224 RepID=A0A5C4VXL6_9ACTN|nr:endonuclease/exonuclease/phosphatase family protein [Nonomuraea phyllanthi]KAB8190549.1 endonuclease/exonuclease/phosphatase family protein [Nonomuraea phyllanthi]QFY05732.1 endonuclease/exonuclease/phosphatase family protein [Nonomuraea phyllanthi]